jgi:P2 family phage contractile tail tube protein
MPLIVHEATNLFVGDDGPNNSKHLNLDTIKLPTLEEVTQTFYPGGGIGEIEVGGLGLKALESTFKIKGYDPQIMSQFGLGSRERKPFTVYGAARDKTGNKAKELKAIMRARLGRIDGDELKRGDLMGHDHKLHEVWHYELYWDGVEKYYYDFERNIWRVDGIDQNADVNNILRIPRL